MTGTSRLGEVLPRRAKDPSDRRVPWEWYLPAPIVFSLQGVAVAPTVDWQIAYLFVGAILLALAAIAASGLIGLGSRAGERLVHVSFGSVTAGTLLFVVMAGAFAAPGEQWGSLERVILDQAANRAALVLVVALAVAVWEASRPITAQTNESIAVPGGARAARDSMTVVCAFAALLVVNGALQYSTFVVTPALLLLVWSIGTIFDVPIRAARRRWLLRLAPAALAVAGVLVPGLFSLTTSGDRELVRLEVVVLVLLSLASVGIGAAVATALENSSSVRR